MYRMYIVIVGAILRLISRQKMVVIIVIIVIVVIVIVGILSIVLIKHKAPINVELAEIGVIIIPIIATITDINVIANLNIHFSINFLQLQLLLLRLIISICNNGLLL